MEYRLSQDDTNGEWVCELVKLTEYECDVARNKSVGIEALNAGAVGYGTSYHKDEDRFSASVRAPDKATARTAAEAYWDAIQNAL